VLRPRWRKVASDLWDNKVRTLLVVASIAAGVFAIGMIAGAHSIVGQDLVASHLATNPANIELVTDPFDADFVEAVRRVAGVGEADGRRIVTVRLERGPGVWANIDLVAVSDCATLQTNLFLPMQGSSVPTDRELLLERRTFDELGAQVGDVLEIQLGDGTRRQMIVAGEVQQPNASIGSLLGDYKAYVTLDTLEWLRHPSSLNRLHITVAEQHDDPAHIHEVADRVSHLIKKSGRQVHYEKLSRSDEYQLASIVEALVGVLSALGVLVLFLSGSLISNTMSALLSQHVRQIGVMKLVGARRFQIIGMYLALIGGFSLIALAIAIPLGGWAAYSLSAIVANELNFVLQGYRLVPRAIVGQILVALVVPPAVGMLPVLSGSRITVGKAFSDTGLGENSSGGQGQGSRRGRPSWIPRPFLMSVRNTFRRKGRLALTLFTLMLGGAIFIAVFNVRVSLNTKVAQLTKYFKADVNLDFARDYPTKEIEQLALEVPGVEHVEAWLMTRAELLQAHPSTPDYVNMVAPPSDSQLVVPILLQGRWLVPGDETALAVSEAFWQDYPDLRAGDRIGLDVAGHEAEWTVVGIFQFTGTEDLLAYTNYEYLAGLLSRPDRAAAYRVVTAKHDRAFQEEVGTRLNHHFDALGFLVTGVEAGATFVGSITQTLDVLIVVLLVLALLTALVGSIGLAGTLSMNVLERSREIGVMRAIGADNRIITRLVLIEATVIGLMSFILSVLLSFPFTTLLSDIVNLAIFNHRADFALTPQGFVVWLILVLLMSATASILPARSASRLTIREVLAYQ